MLSDECWEWIEPVVEAFNGEYDVSCCPSESEQKRNQEVTEDPSTVQEITVPQVETRRRRTKVLPITVIVDIQEYDKPLTQSGCN